MRWRSCVLTAKRKEPTLRECLESVCEAGWPDAKVYAEPGADPISERFVVHERNLGIGGNWMFALRDSIEHGCDAVLILQDDAVMAANCREYLERTWPEQAHILWLYRSERTTQKSRLIGWRPTDPSRQTVYGCLAVAMSGVTAERIDREIGDKLSRLRLGFDVHMQDRVTKHLGMRIYQHRPSLVQHIGRTSILHPGMFLSVSRRAGDDWIRDAKEWSDAVGSGDHDGARQADPDPAGDG
jgi:hypothetical protein